MIIFSQPNVNNIPNTLGGMYFWFDANDPNNDGSQLSDTSAVSTWYDKGPFQYDITQGTGGEQPIFNLDEQAGLPGIAFDGSDDNLSFDGSVDFSMFTSQEFFCVCKATDDATLKTLLAQLTAADRSYDYRILASEANNLVTENATDGIVSTNSTSSGITNTQIFNAYITPSEQGVTTNNETFSTDSLSAAIDSSAQVPRIGQRSDGVETFNGSIFEAIFFNRKLTDAKRNDIRNNLANKWGIDI